MRVLEWLQRTPRFGFIITVLLCGGLLSIGSHAVASPVTWAIAGPGTTSAVANSPTDWDLSYNLNRGPEDFEEKSWSVSATAPEPGDYTFLWDYSGFHAFFMVTVFLESSTGDVLVEDGPENCCTPPSQSFHYSGAYSFSDVKAGKTIGFTMGGDNFDSDNRLIGKLNLKQVLTPGPQTAQSGVLQPDPVVHATPSAPVRAPGEALQNAAKLHQLRAQAANRSSSQDPAAVSGASDSSNGISKDQAIVPDVSDALGSPLPDPEDNLILPPGDPKRLSIFRNTTVPVNSELTSANSEPSTDQFGKNIFATGNYHAEFSKDNGKTWQGLDLDAIFGPDFCCDQVTIYDPAHNRQHWVLQYMPFFNNKPGEGHLTLANSEKGDFVNWCPYTIAPSTLGRSAADEEALDYNDLVVGTHYLYLTTRIIKQFRTDGEPDYNIKALVLLRISLDDLAACRPAHYDVILRTDITDALKVVQGITDVAYVGASSPTVGKGRILRMLVWPENSQILKTVDRAIPTFSYIEQLTESEEIGQVAPATAPPNCASEDGTVDNWCAEANSGLLSAARGSGYLWFAWDARQYSDKRPFPYTRITQVRESDLGLAGSRDLYGLTVAHVLAALAPDRRGHIGLIDSFGGGTGSKHYFPGSMVGIFDDISPESPSVNFFLFGQGDSCFFKGGISMGAWGDYNTIRGSYSADGVWTATSYARNDNNEIICPAIANVTIKNINFGRERDRVNYERVITTP
jgi:hypothetical protein